MKKGIAIAGNIVCDTIKMIDSYPASGLLSTISSVGMSTGGCVSNTGIDLKVIDPSLPVKALGLIGNDDAGAFVTGIMRQKGVDVTGVRSMTGEHTSFTDVMTVQGSGERTFFHMRGANSRFSFEHIDFDTLEADIFLLGYALLLDAMDAPDPQYGTVFARTLHAATQRGMRTSMDVVSENSDRFARVVTPSLRYTDYLIINEVEAGAVVGIQPRDEQGRLRGGNIRRILDALLSAGVRKLVCIHAPEGGYIKDTDGNFACAPSFALPAGYIKGTVGAGDAFCAGMLYALYQGLPYVKALDFANGAAACNLASENAIDGMRDYEGIQALIAGLSYRDEQL